MRTQGALNAIGNRPIISSRKEHEEWDIGTDASQCRQDLSVYKLHMNSNIQTEIVYIYIYMGCWGTVLSFIISSAAQNKVT